MLAKEFYSIIRSEETTVSFLLGKGLITNGDDLPPRAVCGYESKFYTRAERGRDRKAIRRKRSGRHQKTQSVR